MKKRMILIDILKVVFALTIFLRHAVNIGECNIHLLSSQVLKTISGNMVTAFFIISGFSLYYVYNSKRLDNTKNIIDFYKKRAISILPIYFLVIFVHFFFEPFIVNIWLFPIEITGIHSFFDHTIDYLHNGTTWFVSCILLSYFIYPLIQEFVKYASRKKRIFALIFLIAFLVYLPIVFAKFGITGTYSNPLFRCFEFSLGVLLCSVIRFNEIRVKNHWIIILFFLTFFANLLICRYPLSFLKYPLIVLMVFLAALYRSAPNKMCVIVSFFVSLSYPFYILQDFIWTKNKYLFSKIMSINNVDLRLIVFFLILFVLSIIVTFLYQKPISKYLMKKTEKN